jgi:DNA invertase Pin-like site-specific DNA recombinase
VNIGYARVSTADQNPEIQTAALERAGCWPIYEEKKSGKKGEKRPVRDEVLRSLKPGDTLVVWKLDRLGRSLTDLEAIVNGLERRGVKFRSLTEHIDTSTAQGQLFFQILAAFAEFERTLIIERTTAAKQHMIANGKHPGGPRLFGFEKDHVTVIEAEQALLLEAASRLLAGEPEPVSRVVDDWNTRGVPSSTGRTWKVTALRHQLTNPRITGVIGHERYEALVRLFSASERRQHLGRPAQHLLSGILKCAQCEQPMYAVRVADNRWTYRCRKADGSGGRSKGCGSTSVSLPSADEWMAEAFVKAACGPSFAKTLNERRAALLAGDVTPEQIDAWKQEIDELELILQTRFGMRDHKVRHDELQRHVRTATATLLERPELEELLDLPKTEGKGREAWESWSVDRRRRYLKAMLRCVWVLPAPKGHRTGRNFDGKTRLDPDWRV